MKKNLIIIFVATIFLGSCVSLQNTYFPVGPTVSNLDSSGSSNIRFGGNFTSFNMQASYAISDNFGLATNLYIGKPGQRGGELGLVYYNKISKNTYFESQFGYGILNVDYDIEKTASSLWGSGETLNQKVECLYHKAILQPSVLHKMSEWFTIGLSIKFSPLYYARYEDIYEITPYGGRNVHTYDVKEYASISFNDKFGYSVEPGFTCWFGKGSTKFWIQSSYAYTSYVNESNVYVIQEGTSNIFDEVKQSQPRTKSPIISIGIEVRFGK